MSKKSLSFLLALMLVLSCMTALPLPVVALDSPTGTPITSLDAITDLTADYYLNADIGTAETPNTVSIPDAFTGTLDGNGKTIYTSVPVFAVLGEGATVKNLTLKGSITAADENVGALVKEVSGSITLEAVTNEVNITYSNSTVATKVGVGGLVGAVGNMAANASATADTDLCTLTLTRCTNKGTILATSEKCIAFIGGLVGGARCRLLFTDCVNDGAITIGAASAFQMRVGGMVGQTVMVNTESIDSVGTSVFQNCSNSATILYQCTVLALTGGIVGYYDCQNAVRFEDCENSGTIEQTAVTAGSKSGGIAGVLTQNTPHEYINCVNTADINVNKSCVGGLVGQDCGECSFIGCGNEGNISMTNHASASFVGGIVGYASGASTSGTHRYISCTNQGAVTGSGSVGGIVGSDSGVIEARACVNTGTVTQPEASTIAAYVGGIIGRNNGTANQTAVSYIESCTNVADIVIKTSHTTNLIGGIVGSGELQINRVVTNCFNSGDITVVADGGGSKTGGIAGYFYPGASGFTVLTGCVNRGNVESYRFSGGICGQIGQTSKFISCINSGAITIKTGATTADAYAAGIVAYDGGSAPIFYSCVNSGILSNSVSESAIADLGKSGTLYFCESAGTTTVEFAGVQRSVAVVGETDFSVRFVSRITDIGEYSSIGVLIYVAEQGCKDVELANLSTNTVYTQISGSANGVDTVYPETPVEGTYFSAITVTDIPADGSYTFIVIPYTIALDGITQAFGEACAVEVNNGVIESTGVYQLAD